MLTYPKKPNFFSWMGNICSLKVSMLAYDLGRSQPSICRVHIKLYIGLVGFIFVFLWHLHTYLCCCAMLETKLFMKQYNYFLKLHVQARDKINIWKKVKEMHLSHCSGETISALNRTSAFKLDFAATDSVRFSKSPCEKKFVLSYKRKGPSWLYEIRTKMQVTCGYVRLV
jgi:hypothetical protein